MQKLSGLEAARTVSSPLERLRALEKAAPAVRDHLLQEGPVRALKVCPLVSLPYPTTYGFSGAALSPAPYLWIQNRLVIVQYEAENGRRTLLFEASDTDRGSAAPFYKQRMESFGPFLTDRVLSQRFATVPEALAKNGLSPDDVDELFFDHLHLQDLRGWLGDGERPGLFPRAKLLVHRKEWQTARAPHPLQAPWYVPNAQDNVPKDRVVLLDGDVHLGKGLALVFTPGHTEGNMSLAVVTPRGLFVSSENGIAADSWAPEHSAIAGVKRHARAMGFAVVMNGNTRDGSAEQYTSMILERALAGPSAMNPDFCNVLPSSELVPWVLAPGLRPSFSHGDISFGTLRKREQ